MNMYYLEEAILGTQNCIYDTTCVSWVLQQHFIPSFYYDVQLLKV